MLMVVIRAWAWANKTHDEINILEYGSRVGAESQRVCRHEGCTYALKRRRCACENTDVVALIYLRAEPHQQCMYKFLSEKHVRGKKYRDAELHPHKRFPCRVRQGNRLFTRGSTSMVTKYTQRRRKYQHIKKWQAFQRHERQGRMLQVGIRPWNKLTCRNDILRYVSRAGADNPRNMSISSRWCLHVLKRTTCACEKKTTEIRRYKMNLVHDDKQRRHREGRQWSKERQKAQADGIDVLTLALQAAHNKKYDPPFHRKDNTWKPRKDHDKNESYTKRKIWKHEWWR